MLAVSMNRNKEKTETELFLQNQLDLGFNPKWFVSIHYLHPTENCWRKYEDIKPLGFGSRIGFKSRYGFWNEVSMDNGLNYRRNDYDSLIDDTSQVKNVILKELYGIKRLNQDWKYDFPNLFFFQEKGKVKLQYHTHLLMPQNNCKYDTIEELYNSFNITIRRKRKCFSKWKTIHIREIDNPQKALSYVNKETNKFHNSLDYENSIFILPQV